MPGGCEIKRHRQMRHGPPCLVGERDELFDGLDASLVAEDLQERGTSQVSLLADADAASEQPPSQGAHPVALSGRQHFGLETAVDPKASTPSRSTRAFLSSTTISPSYALSERMPSEPRQRHPNAHA